MSSEAPPAAAAGDDPKDAVPEDTPMVTDPPAAEPATTEAAADGAGSAEGAGPAAAEELVPPEVDAALQSELEAMGFSAARCVRALHFTGSSGVESAVNWIVEHEEDPDIDTPLLVSKEDQSGPKLTPEEARKKAAELLERARRRKEEEEKRMEREREQNRIRSGKEILEAKRKAEDEERKRRLDERRREKDEEKRAKDRILQKLAEDKRERRRKLGLPEVEPPKAEAAAAPAAAAKDASSSAKAAPPSGLPGPRPVSKAEKMREALRLLKQHHKGDGDKVTRAFETLFKYVSNLGQHPDQEKFRRIRVTNAAFQERVGCYPESFEFLALCGFERDGGPEAEFLAMSPEKLDVAVLRVACGELNSAITNPYFGVL